MGRPRFKHHEFWPPRIFELPFYVYLAWQCLINWVGPRTLAKANYALYHGEIGLGSKYQTQQCFPVERFPATTFLPASLNDSERIPVITQFAARHGFPVILKPDIGMTGKGLIKLREAGEIHERLGELQGDYLLQAFCDEPLEFGVFYYRLNGTTGISGINQKHFPSVTGDGQQTIQQLAMSHSRFSDHWNAFLQYVDLQYVPAEGENVLLSFIGSHTLGCLFTDDSHILTDTLQSAVCDFVGPVKGYNFGRLDVRAASVAALQRGEFTVIEVNGVSSLPTHMFDPGYRLKEAYRIFFQHGRLLVKIARENRHQSMSLMPLFEVVREVRASQRKLNALHKQQQLRSECIRNNN